MHKEHRYISVILSHTHSCVILKLHTFGSDKNLAALSVRIYQSFVKILGAAQNTRNEIFLPIEFSAHGQLSSLQCKM